MEEQKRVELGELGKTSVVISGAVHGQVFVVMYCRNGPALDLHELIQAILLHEGYLHYNPQVSGVRR